MLWNSYSYSLPFYEAKKLQSIFWKPCFTVDQNYTAKRIFVL